MKNLFKIVFALLGILLILSPAAIGVAQAFGTSPGETTLGIVAVGLVSYMFKPVQLPGVHTSGVQVEIWVNYIIERLWKNNGWLKNAFSDDDKVLAGKVVHIPQPGAMPTVVKNRNVFPGTAVRRNDTDVTYALNEYTTDPTHIPDADKVELSYDKIDSTYSDHAGVLAETIGDDIILNWLGNLPASSILRTTGAGVPATLEGATGNRKAFGENDLRRAATLLNKQNVPATDRHALLTVDMEDQLKQSLTATQYRDYSSAYDAVNGVVGRLHGFNIYTRSSVAVATSAAAIKALGAAVVGTDNEVSLVWQKNAVARALGEVKFFENENRAEYYGDIYSALVRMGGRRRREDNKGIVAIIQDASA